MCFCLHTVHVDKCVPERVVARSSPHSIRLHLRLLLRVPHGQVDMYLCVFCESLV